MLEAGPSSSGFASDRPAGARAFLVSSVLEGADVAHHVGGDAYSYHFVYRAFAPLLQRLGAVAEVDHPESRLDYAIRQTQQRGRAPVHLSFRPLQATYLSSLAPNLAFPFWEFPDVPNEDFNGNPRNNWVRIASRLDGILCASEFTRAAFARAGVPTPVHVVPVPIRDQYFDVPQWESRAAARLDCPAYVFPHESNRAARAGSNEPPGGTGVWWRAYALAQQTLRATLPLSLDRRVGLLGQAVRSSWRGTRYGQRMPLPTAPAIELSGVVYTSLVNPFDQRKNWQDLLSAFLLALREQDDATMVLKLVSPRALTPSALGLILECYEQLAIRHRCRLVIVPQYLSDPQLLELTRLTTYYVTATRAEGACLPVQDFLAAGRPVVAPAHSALAEYLRPDIAFLVESHPEPTWWPHDRSGHIRTTWHRLVWQSLHDQLQSSYRVAKHEHDRYVHLARRSRERMREFASHERVWPRLRAALSASTHEASARR